MKKTSLDLLEKTSDNLYLAQENFNDFINSLDEKGQNLLENNFIQEMLKLTVKDKLDDIIGLVDNLVKAGKNTNE